MLVVDAMDDPVHARSDPTVGLEVEDDAVQPILEQRPQRIAAGEQSDRLGHAHKR